MECLVDDQCTFPKNHRKDKKDCIIRMGYLGRFYDTYSIKKPGKEIKMLTLKVLVVTT